MTLRDKILAVISETLGVEKNKISLTDNFFDDLNADKVEVADLFFKIQKLFNLNTDEEETENQIGKIQTVADLISFVEENIDEY